MHKENLVVSIVTSEGICRENSGQVYLPYGTEYALRIKNLDVLYRVVVNINIDGDSVTESGIIIGAGQTFDLKGFLKGNSVKNSFKFIEMTDKIRHHKGDRPDWGVITVSFQFEEYSCPQYVPRPPFQPRWPYEDYNKYPNNPWDRRRPNITFSTNSVCRSKSIISCAVNNSSNEQGLTVPGTPINQDFKVASVGRLGPAHTISLQLVGQRPDNQPVKVLRTSRRAPCPTCGTRQRGNAKYCTECSTCLL